MTTRKLRYSMVGLVFAGVVGYVYVSYTVTPAPSEAIPCVPPAAEPGPSWPWEAGLGVGTYTEASTRHGNLFTAVPIVSWAGGGPDVNMVLYHNSANVNSSLDLTRGMGFDLGPGWTTFYSAQLIFDPPLNPTTVTAIADDGTQDVYTWNIDHWEAPPGVFDVLSEQSGLWYITHKDQSYHRFASDGLLSRIVDPTGNAITLTRLGGQLRRITDAVGRKLIFTYSSGRLVKIKDPKEVDEPGASNLEDREWTFSYDVQDRLTQVLDPMGFTIGFAYDTDGRITSLTDKDDDAFDYAYDEGRIQLVTDPPEHGNPLPVRLTQSFTFVCFPTGKTETTYADRRGSNSTYSYDSAANLESFANPLAATEEFAYDSDRNRTLYRDALDNEWTATYDTQGNLLTLLDPLTNQQTMQYDALNNIVEYTDAEGNLVSLHYDHPDHPTLRTSVVEPGSPAPTTTLDYYTSSDPSDPPASNGLLKEVIDPEGVVTSFSYDQWGQRATYGEGAVPAQTPVFDRTTIFDSGSRLVSSFSPVSGGGQEHDPNNRPTRASCIMTLNPMPDPPVPPGFPPLPCDPSGLPDQSAEWTAQYTNMDLLTNVDVDLVVGVAAYTRTHTAEYDEFGFPTTGEVRSNESGSWVTRTFTYDHDLATGEYTRVGPDGVDSLMQFDTARRLQLYRRGPAGDPVMTAVYTYHADDRVESVTNGNGTSIWYTYDAARRMTKIEHRDLLGQMFYRLEYTYDGRDLPLTLTESDAVGLTATVTFTYDTHGRLTAEERTGQNPYDLAYQYDLGGNRTRKVDALNDTEVVYHYDLEDPLVYGSDNNRLEYYESFDTSGQDPVLVSTTWYYYNASGNVKQVVTKQAGMNDYSSTRLVYAGNGRVVSYVMGETWTWDGDPETCPTAYDITYAREFRYDEARQRYLNRELDPTELLEGNIETLAETWSDYDGDEVHGDFRLDNGVPVELRSFELDIAKADPWTATGGGGTNYYHADLIGTTRWMSNPSGTGESPAAYTAFGERISGSMSGLGDRYNYVGAEGYQSHEEFPFLHVGARYYDPSTGRFLQRDPSGIEDGTNVYEYARSSPTLWIDLDGTQKHKRRDKKTGRFKKARRIRVGGKGGKGGPAALVVICLELFKTHVVPLIDKAIEDDFKKKMKRLNDPGTPPPGLGDYPVPPPGGPKWT